ncbi:MAG: hypothetical protein P8Z76_16585 [Alphaproteobacteria bacterium]
MPDSVSPLTGDAADAGLPGVEMGVDQAGHDDHARGVDHLGPLARLDGGCYSGDPVVFHQHVAAVQHADRRVHRDDPAAFDQNPSHETPAWFGCANKSWPGLHRAGPADATDF